MAHLGNTIINGVMRIIGGLYTNTINGVTVGDSPKFTDTTYSSKAAANGGTDVSLVTTGEKYTWNNKTSLAIGSTATTAAAGNHTHTTSLATDSGTSSITLGYGSKYKLTAGGNSVIFTMPSSDNTNTTYTFTGGTNKFTVTPSGGTATDVTVTPNLTIKAANGSNIGSVGTPSVSASTSGTTTTFTFDYLKGTAGTRGSRISFGTAITGTSTTATAFSGSGITDALVNDEYINTGTWTVYKCTTGGNAATAKWVYVGTMTTTATDITGTAAYATNLGTSSANYTKSSLDTALNGKASSTHTHGNITNAGALQANDISIASGDKLVVTDSSDSSKIARASISFDGSTATQALTKKGTWETFLTSHQDISGKADKTATVSTVSYTSKKLTKTINGSATDVVAASTIVSDGLPSGGSSGKVLKYKSNGTTEWGDVVITSSYSNGVLTISSS